MVSKRAVETPASPIRRLVPYADEAKKRGINIYYLNIGQPDIKTPSVWYEYIDKYKPEVVAYTHSQGLLELREAFSKYYARHNIHVSADEIMVTNGGSEAIMFALGVVCDPGDEVITIEPFYANYLGFASYLNVKLVPVTAHTEDGYRLPPMSEFEKVVSPKTKAILFSNPSNPTGTVYTYEEMKQIVEFAKKHNLVIISDEVYREFTFDGRKHISVFHFEGIEEQTIMVDSISKRYSACGARIGTLVTKNKEFYKSALKFAQARLCPAETTQFGAIGLLTLGEEYTNSVRDEYQKRRDATYEAMKEIPGVVVHKPEGAFYLSAKLPVDNAEDFIIWMLKEFNVDGKTTMVSPLSGFYATPGAGMSEIRIAYVLEAEKLADAVRILGEGIREYNKRK
ncbi:MAG: pyridoxal phosphate-dependent aminotransferase [Fervidobacterium sp.]|uniref:Aminotransferase n=2 Tax=Fervidobacterium TaxID=2422 RepID=A7HJ49_FERNB|nr:MULTISPECIES: pyridoxal phosphate-dependent aminotransferase [Fervidobacterium]ABS59932.1 aminotransferase class I and II [Fervidobacterium nodosum Rt17-B1]UXF01786.1 aspartate aminotransferase [Fervidobacterium riparium]SHN70283.1 aspartate aminotransferase [Fervidobacterium gondwanense DSM 13020]